MLYTLALLLIAFAIAISSGFGSTASALLDPASLILVLGIPLVLLGVAGLMRDFLRAFKILTAKENIYTREELSNSLLATKSFITYLWLSACFGTLLGLVMSLSQSTHAKDLMPSLSVSLLMAFYASLIHLLISILPGKIMRLLNHEGGQNEG